MSPLMSRRLYHGLLLLAMLLLPALAAAGWWYYWPTYQRQRLQTTAEQALAANDLGRAEEALKQLLADNPDQLRPQFLYAQVLRRLGRTHDAWEPLHRAIQLGLPEADGLREYALLEARDDPQLAENALRRVLNEHPDDQEVLQTLAENYVRRGRWLDAERIYTLWLELQPGREDLLFERGRTRIESGHLDLAASDFRAILVTSPQHFRARLLLCQCLLHDARIDEAEAELQVCRKLRPGQAEPLVGLASCALERDELDPALVLIKEALALDPSSLIALHVEGQLYLRRQRYDLAIPVYEKIVRLVPSDKLGHLYLAQALSQGGDPERARKHEERFQQLDREEEHRAHEARRIP
jgi:predicted Zn-dependent protease